jgi:hypothetical protein
MIQTMLDAELRNVFLPNAYHLPTANGGEFNPERLIIVNSVCMIKSAPPQQFS